MSNEKTQRLTDSPRKPTHLQVSRKLSRGGDDDDDIYDMEEYYNLQERRGSSQSMSRYNSCPQLADVEEDLQECFEKTVDDINTNVGALSHDLTYTGTTHSRSPLLQRKQYLENGQVSDTPTPPSTPKSRRSIISSRDSLLSSPDKTFVSTSPFASPRLLLRKQMQLSALGRDSSEDSLSELNVKQAELSVENVNRFAEIQSGDDIQKVKSDGRKAKAPVVTVTHHVGERDTLNKCENWLQTLNIAKQDRIKSRSHIQLPPI